MATIIAGFLLSALAMLPLRGADVHVTIYNTAGVPQVTIRSALTQLARILGAAGFRLRWSEMSTPTASFVEDVVPLSSASDTAVRCRASRSIEAWIVPTPTGDESRTALGYSLPLATQGRNVLIFRSVVNTVAARHGVEIGHVLLRSGKHSPHGLMSAAWSDREFEFMSRVPVRFSSREVDLIKKTLAGEGCTDRSAGDQTGIQISRILR
jgi:hypothetical protein